MPDQINPDAGAQADTATVERPQADPVAKAIEHIATLRQLADLVSIQKLAQNKLTVPSSDVTKLIISSLAEWERSAKGGKIPAQHDADCATLAKHDITRELAEQNAKDRVAQLAAVGFTESEQTGVLNNLLKDVALQYDCGCSLSKRKGAGGTRSNPENPGAKWVEVTYADGTVERFDSMSAAAKKMADLFHTKACVKYVETIAAQKAANARVAFYSDIKAHRFPEGVTFTFADDAAPDTDEDADAGDAGTSDQQPADDQQPASEPVVEGAPAE